MAPVRKRLNCLTKKGSQLEGYQTESVEASSKNLKKMVNNNPNIEEWLYGFLRDLAAVEADSKKKKKPFNSSCLDKRRNAVYRRIRSPTPYQWDRRSFETPVPSLQNPVDLNCSIIQNKDISVLESNATKQFNKKCSSPKKNLKKKELKNYTFLQKINNYIRAGIEEGKRQAKLYVRKALTFALQMGYLEPADVEGKMLRLAPVIANAVRRKQARRRLMKRKFMKKTPQKKHSKRKVKLQEIANVSCAQKRKTAKYGQIVCCTKRHNFQKLNTELIKNSKAYVKSNVICDPQETKSVEPCEAQDVKTVVNSIP